MEILISTVAFTFLIAVSFYAGVRFADYYHNKQDAAVSYALKKQFVRLRAGADADDPVQPYVSPDNDGSAVNFLKS